MLKFFLFSLLLFPIHLWATQTHLFAFSRPLKVADSYYFEGVVQVEEKIDILTSSDTLNTSRSQFFTAESEGMMWVKKVNKGGHAIDFDIDLVNVVASYAGARLHHQLNGARIRVNLVSKKPLFTRYDTQRLSKNELTILTQLFRPPPKENLNQLFFGPDSMQMLGVWQAPKKALLMRFNAEKIKAKAENFNAVASAHEMDSQLNLKIEVESKNLNHFDFNMSLTLLLPYDNALPVRRSVRETHYASTVNLDKISTLAPMPKQTQMRRSTHEVARFDMYKK